MAQMQHTVVNEVVIHHYFCKKSLYLVQNNSYNFACLPKKY